MSTCVIRGITSGCPTSNAAAKNCKLTLELGEFACQRCLQTPVWGATSTRSCKEQNSTSKNSYCGGLDFTTRLFFALMSSLLQESAFSHKNVAALVLPAKWAVTADYFPSGKNWQIPDSVFWGITSPVVRPIWARRDSRQIFSGGRGKARGVGRLGNTRDDDGRWEEEAPRRTTLLLPVRASRHDGVTWPVLVRRGGKHWICPGPSTHSKQPIDHLQVGCVKQRMGLGSTEKR